MSYDSRKVLRGQEFVECVDIYFNACKYSIAPYFTNKSASVSSGSYSDSYTGSIPVDEFDLLSTLYDLYFGLTNLYAVFDDSGEVVKITVDELEIDITERGMFGTISSSISGGDTFKIIHQGEADGTCRGFSQTCSDSTSYDENAFKVVSLCTAPMPAGQIKFPGLHHKSIDYESAEIEVGESQGSPAKLRVDCQDFNHNDVYVVPYENRRSVNGTFWGKMIARNPYLNGRKIVYKSGLRDSGSFDDPDWLERHFFIDSVKLSDGKMSITLLDPTILAEEKKAKMPTVSPAQLSSAITGSPSAFNFINAIGYYFGALSSTIYVRIDSEIIKCTVTGATELTVVTRGYRSEQKDHEAGANIQDCVVFSSVHVINCITYALENYTRMPVDYIDDYTDVIALNPSAILEEAIISKPIAVSEFISNMIKIGNLIYYFDESTLKIVIDYIPELSIDPFFINENEHIKRGSLSVDDNKKEQYTRFAQYWAPIDVTKDADENYAIAYMAANLEVESNPNFGEINEKKTYKNPYLTSSSADSLLAVSYCSRIADGADKSPKIVNAIINAAYIGSNESTDIKLGSIVNLTTKENQGVDGLPLADLYQVVKMSGNAFEDIKIKMRRYIAVQPSGVDFVISEGGVNYDLSDYYTPTSGNYTVYIEAGVEFGSFDTSLPAFTTGSQSSGVTFTIINRGSMIGMGGNGGDCGLGNVAPVDGFDGGAAFEATVDCIIDNGSGLIWAGGGGGGGQAPGFNPSSGLWFWYPASGGSGGQGYGNSVGGRKTYGISAATPGTYPTFGGYETGGNRSAPGISGIDGGEWGTDGDSSNASGGLAGLAIKTNGKSVTISSGDNELNIRGRRV